MKPTRLTSEQVKKTVVAMLFSFVSTFLTAFMASGGIQDSWDATFILIASCSVSAMNTALYGLVQLFKDGE